MHILLFLSSALAPLVAASPLLRDLSLTPPTNLTKASTLQWDPLVPWGPDEFDVTTERVTVPIPRDAVFVTTIRFVAEQAAQDFSGRLPRQMVVFRDPSYPSFSIAVSSLSPTHFVKRKYMLWAMARILNHMIADDAFKGSFFRLRWRDEVVGRVLFVAGGRNELDAGFKDVAVTQPRLEMPSLQQMSNSIEVSIGEGSNALTYDFTLHGQVLVKQDVFMATLGGLIQVASHEGHTFNFWVGSFPGYRCFHVYRSIVQPSVTTKDLVIVTMVAAMAYALRHNDWRELGVLLKRDGEPILRGGYLDHPLPPDQQGVSSS